MITAATEYAASLSNPKMYDFTYVAVAKERDIPLVTLDQDLITKGRTIYSKIYTPAEFLASHADHLS